MRKSIDRKATRKTIREKLFLRSLTRKTIRGKAIPGKAFGSVDLDYEPMSGQMVTHYNFSIGIDCGHLKLVVDAYTASGRAAQAGNAWDADQWESEQITFTAWPISRRAFRELARTARLLLAGFDVRILGTDLYVKGIPNAVRIEAYAIRTLPEMLSAIRSQGAEG